MKIPLLTSLSHPEMDYLNNAVLLQTPRKLLNTYFILDTGSPRTMLGYLDAKRLQIPFDDLPKTEIVRMGGRKYQGFSFKRLTFNFRTEDGKLIKEDFSVNVIKPTSEANEQELTSIPTIIGMDFLKEKSYKLFCDMKNNLAYLERDDANQS